MTASPLLPPGAARPIAEAEATEAELSRMTELALGRGARSIAIGRGSSPVATRAAAGFARRTGRVIGLVGAHNLPGLTGPTADGGTWQVRHGILQATPHHGAREAHR